MVTRGIDWDSPSWGGNVHVCSTGSHLGESQTLPADLEGVSW